MNAARVFEKCLKDQSLIQFLNPEGLAIELSRGDFVNLACLKLFQWFLEEYELGCVCVVVVISLTFFFQI